MKFRPGTVVVLPSGSPNMTVLGEKIAEGYSGVELVECGWFVETPGDSVDSNDCTLRTVTLPAAALDEVEQ